MWSELTHIVYVILLYRANCTHSEHSLTIHGPLLLSVSSEELNTPGHLIDYNLHCSYSVSYPIPWLSQVSADFVCVVCVCVYVCLCACAFVCVRVRMS